MMSDTMLNLLKDRVIDLNRLLLFNMTEGERILFLECIFEGYCQNCGRMTNKTCHCENDE